MEGKKITDLLELDLELSRLEGFLAILYNLFEKTDTMDMAVGSEARNGYIWLTDTMKKSIAGVDIKQIRESTINDYQEQQKAQGDGKKKEKGHGKPEDH